MWVCVGVGEGVGVGVGVRAVLDQFVHACAIARYVFLGGGFNSKHNFFHDGMQLLC